MSRGRFLKAPRRRRAFDLAAWLLVAMIAGIAIELCLASREPGASATGEGDGPFARIARVDRGDPVLALAFAPGGRLLASCTFSGDLALCDPATGSRIWSIRCPGASVDRLASSADGRILALTGPSIPVQFRDSVTGEEVPGPKVVGKVVAFSKDGATLAVGRGDGSLMLVDRAARRPSTALGGHRGAINALDFSPDGRWLASGGVDGLARIWDPTGGRELAQLEDHEPHAPVAGVQFSSDGRWLATARTKGRAVWLWDPAIGASRGALPADGFGVSAFAFAPRGLLLAVAQGDGSLVFWDPARRAIVGRLRAQAGNLIAMVFSNDGRILATGGRDGCVRLWDVAQVLALGPLAPSGKSVGLSRPAP